ncbi:hypothetical protein [Spirochaeta cellobiosiphila]|uniref:hypothetical protein n=1 Tax=Spirochaeta cellobiosiphila TaxID=504483 RepID=UPI0004152D09|nr:hypothetical protein [Spirochaeta cellobiosiphila]
MSSNNHIRQYKHLTQIIFFDLEFYVPVKDRESERKDLRANPFQEGHFLMGGTFTKKNPLLPDKKLNTIDFWIWRYHDNETVLLEAIVTYLENVWNEIKEKPDQTDLIIAGIGVSRADLGYLYSKSLQHNTRSQDHLFSIFYQLRIIELESMAVPFFSNKNGLLYPKTTGQLLDLFNINRERKSGTEVWGAYDGRDFKSIEERNSNEVTDMIQIYDRMVASIHSQNASIRFSSDVYSKLMSLVKKDKDKNYIKHRYTHNKDSHVLKAGVGISERYKLFKIMKTAKFLK